MEKLAARGLGTFGAQGFDGNPRGAARARNIDGRDARLVQVARHMRGDATAGFLDHDGLAQLLDHPADGVQALAKVGVASRLG